jgi:hypothetical protein
MRKQATFCTAAVLALVLFEGLGSKSIRADFITYDITVNTSSLSGQGGNLDFQFNPGNGSALGATVTITNGCSCFLNMDF